MRKLMYCFLRIITVLLLSLGIQSLLLAGNLPDGGLFVAVGGGDKHVSTILTSKDGLSWTPQKSGFLGVLAGVTWGDNEFVAVGENGLIITSPDGIVWTKQESNTNSTLARITWSGTQYAVLGFESLDYPPNPLLVSSDGNNWVVQNKNYVLQGIKWVGTQYLLVGSSMENDTNFIWRSSDGINWITEPEQFDSDALESIGWNNNDQYIIGADTTVFVSGDAINWSGGYPVPPYAFGSIVWDGERYIASAENDYTGGGGILISSDGINWTTVYNSSSLLAGLAWNGARYVVVDEAGGISTSADGVNWALTARFPTHLEDVAFGPTHN